jgi:TetR/AcrR family transcriptional regulator, transcriptional repressor for nem operon
MARNREFDEEKVLNIATDLFWQKGYHAVSTADLLEAFGIGRSSMYAAYKDKRSLFLLAFSHYRKTTTQAMLTLLASQGKALDILEKILESIVKQSVTDTNRKGCFVVNTAIELAPHDTEILELIRENRNNIVNAIAQCIQKGIDAHELSPANEPVALGHYFYNIINGLRVDAKVINQPAHFMATVKLAMKVVQVA